MENSQPENCYTKIANELLDALISYRLPGEQMQCLMVIIRKTYGWGKKSDAIALGQFVEMTGIKKPNVVRALNGLLSKKIIAIIKNDNVTTHVYEIIKDSSKWEPLSKKITLSKKIINVIKKDNEALSKKSTTKETIKEKKEKKKKEGKDQYLEYVFLTRKEYKTLLGYYGEERLTIMIDKLDNWIGVNPEINGKDYVNFSRVIQGWVADSLGFKKGEHNANVLKCKGVTPEGPCPNPIKQSNIDHMGGLCGECYEKTLNNFKQVNGGE